MMNTKFKSYLLLGIILIIGIAIGFEISEIMVRQRFSQMDKFRKPRGFLEIFEKTIQPDSIQKPKVEQIILKYHNKMEEISKLNMKQISAQIDSMASELKSILSMEQIEKLNAEIERMRKQPPPRDKKFDGPPMKDGRPMPPPPDGGGPPPFRPM